MELVEKELENEGIVNRTGVLASDHFACFDTKIMFLCDTLSTVNGNP